MDTGIAIYNRYFSDQANNVGYAAHFGGALCGKSFTVPNFLALSLTSKYP